MSVSLYRLRLRLSVIATVTCYSGFNLKLPQHDVWRSAYKLVEVGMDRCPSFALPLVFTLQSRFESSRMVRSKD